MWKGDRKSGSREAYLKMTSHEADPVKTAWFLDKQFARSGMRDLEQFSFSNPEKWSLKRGLSRSSWNLFWEHNGTEVREGERQPDKNTIRSETCTRLYSTRVQWKKMPCDFFKSWNVSFQFLKGPLSRLKSLSLFSSRGWQAVFRYSFKPACQTQFNPRLTSDCQSTEDGGQQVDRMRYLKIKAPVIFLCLGLIAEPPAF